MKEVLHLRMENYAILNNMQNIQSGLGAPLQHFDIYLESPQGFASNPLWTKEVGYNQLSEVSSFFFMFMMLYNSTLSIDPLALNLFVWSTVKIGKESCNF